MESDSPPPGGGAKKTIRRVVRWCEAISHHRAVKKAFAQWGQGVVVPRHLPFCVRLSIARSVPPANPVAVDEVYQQLLAGGKPLTRRWVWLPWPLPMVVVSDHHRATIATACVRWLAPSFKDAQILVE